MSKLISRAHSFSSFSLYIFFLYWGIIRTTSAEHSSLLITSSAGILVLMFFWFLLMLTAPFLLLIIFRVLVPDGKKLKEIADQLSQDLHHQNDILSQLMKNVSFYYMVLSFLPKILPYLTLFISLIMTMLGIPCE